VDLTPVAVELLDRLPANRTLGLTVAEAVDGVGRVVMPVSEAVRNVIAALHSSGVAALADAAALAEALSAAPDEATARRLQPLGIQARLTFQRPIRGTAFATCHIDLSGRAALARLWERQDERARFTTVTTIDGDEAPGAATGEFDWIVRLSPG
jgi:acyl-coenzyme A thioesterase PaaI-like protein